jgi:hypothetical protein
MTTIITKAGLEFDRQQLDILCQADDRLSIIELVDKRLQFHGNKEDSQRDALRTRLNAEEIEERSRLPRRRQSAHGI